MLHATSHVECGTSSLVPCPLCLIPCTAACCAPQVRSSAFCAVPCRAGITACRAVHANRPLLVPRKCSQHPVSAPVSVLPVPRQCSSALLVPVYHHPTPRDGRWPTQLLGHRRDHPNPDDHRRRHSAHHVRTPPPWDGRAPSDHSFRGVAQCGRPPSSEAYGSTAKAKKALRVFCLRFAAGAHIHTEAAWTAKTLMRSVGSATATLSTCLPCLTCLAYLAYLANLPALPTLSTLPYLPTLPTLPYLPCLTCLAYLPCLPCLPTHGQLQADGVPQAARHRRKVCTGLVPVGEPQTGAPTAHCDRNTAHARTHARTFPLAACCAHHGAGCARGPPMSRCSPFGQRSPQWRVPRRSQGSGWSLTSVPSADARFVHVDIVAAVRGRAAVASCQ
jgi:hypothetical protein